MSDPRSRAFTRGVHVSGLGANGSKYVAGARREIIEAVPNYVVHFDADAGITAFQDVGLLARGAYVNNLVNHVALTGGTVAVSLIDPAGMASPINLDTDLALNAAARNATGAFVTPLASDRIVRVTITGGTAGETAILSLEIGVLRPDWN
jgi:hypothetical protein